MSQSDNEENEVPENIFLPKHSRQDIILLDRFR